MSDDFVIRRTTESLAIRKQGNSRLLIAGGQGPPGINGINGGVQSSDNSVTDIRKMTQAAYDGIIPNSTTWYIIVG